PTDTSPLSLHDALPIYPGARAPVHARQRDVGAHAEVEDQPLLLAVLGDQHQPGRDRAARIAEHEVVTAHAHLATARRVNAEDRRSEEHTSELQSRENLV